MTTSTLNPLELAVLGWQSECALQPHAAHLALHWRYALGNDKLPADALACIAFGREALRAHLAAVRGDPDRSPIETPASQAAAPALRPAPAFEVHLKMTTKTMTRTRTTELCVLSGGEETTAQFAERVESVIVSMDRE